MAGTKIDDIRVGLGLDLASIRNDAREAHQAIQDLTTGKNQSRTITVTLKATISDAGIKEGLERIESRFKGAASKWRQEGALTISPKFTVSPQSVNGLRIQINRELKNLARPVDGKTGQAVTLPFKFGALGMARSDLQERVNGMQPIKVPFVFVQQGPTPGGGQGGGPAAGGGGAGARPPRTGGPSGRAGSAGPTVPPPAGNARGSSSSGGTRQQPPRQQQARQQPTGQTRQTPPPPPPASGGTTSAPPPPPPASGGGPSMPPPPSASTTTGTAGSAPPPASPATRPFHQEANRLRAGIRQAEAQMDRAVNDEQYQRAEARKKSFEQKLDQHVRQAWAGRQQARQGAAQARAESQARLRGRGRRQGMEGLGPMGPGVIGRGTTADPNAPGGGRKKNQRIDITNVNAGTHTPSGLPPADFHLGNRPPKTTGVRAGRATRGLQPMTREEAERINAVLMSPEAVADRARRRADFEAALNAEREEQAKERQSDPEAKKVFDAFTGVTFDENGFPNTSSLKAIDPRIAYAVHAYLIGDRDTMRQNFRDFWQDTRGEGDFGEPGQGTQIKRTRKEVARVRSSGGSRGVDRIDQETGEYVPLSPRLLAIDAISKALSRNARAWTDHMVGVERSAGPRKQGMGRRNTQVEPHSHVDPKTGRVKTTTREEYLKALKRARAYLPQKTVGSDEEPGPIDGSLLFRHLFGRADGGPIKSGRSAANGRFLSVFRGGEIPEAYPGGDNFMRKVSGYGHQSAYVTPSQQYAELYAYQRGVSGYGSPEGERRLKLKADRRTARGMVYGGSVPRSKIATLDDIERLAPNYIRQGLSKFSRGIHPDAAPHVAGLLAQHGYGGYSTSTDGLELSVFDPRILVNKLAGPKGPLPMAGGGYLRVYKGGGLGDEIGRQSYGGTFGPGSYLSVNRETAQGYAQSGHQPENWGNEENYWKAMERRRARGMVHEGVMLARDVGWPRMGPGWPSERNSKRAQDALRARGFAAAGWNAGDEITAWNTNRIIRHLAGPKGPLPMADGGKRDIVGAGMPRRFINVAGRPFDLPRDADLAEDIYEFPEMWSHSRRKALSFMRAGYMSPVGGPPPGMSADRPRIKGMADGGHTSWAYRNQRDRMRMAGWDEDDITAVLGRGRAPSYGGSNPLIDPDKQREWIERAKLARQGIDWLDRRADGGYLGEEFKRAGGGRLWVPRTQYRGRAANIPVLPSHHGELGPGLYMSPDRNMAEVFSAYSQARGAQIDSLESAIDAAAVDTFKLRDPGSILALTRQNRLPRVLEQEWVDIINSLPSEGSYKHGRASYPWQTLKSNALEALFDAPRKAWSGRVEARHAYGRLGEPFVDFLMARGYQGVAGFGLKPIGLEHVDDAAPDNTNIFTPFIGTQARRVMHRAGGGRFARRPLTEVDYAMRAERNYANRTRALDGMNYTGMANIADRARWSEGFAARNKFWGTSLEDYGPGSMSMDKALNGDPDGIALLMHRITAANSIDPSMFSNALLSDEFRGDIKDVDKNAGGGLKRLVGMAQRKPDGSIAQRLAKYMGPVPLSSNTRIKAAEAGIREVFPHATASLGSLHPDMAMDIADQLVHLGNRFPFTAGLIAAVGTAPDDHMRQATGMDPARKVTPVAYAQPIKAGVWGGQGGTQFARDFIGAQRTNRFATRLIFNQDALTPPDVARARARQSFEDNWWTADGIEGTVTHEFGHAVDHAWGYAFTYPVDRLQSLSDSEAWARGLKDDNYRAFHRSWLSEYGRRNPAEAFAEEFSRHNAPIAHPLPPHFYGFFEGMRWAEHDEANSLEAMRGAGYRPFSINGRGYANGGSLRARMPAPNWSAGRVPANAAHPNATLVGERGPEVFIPDQDGWIIPNHLMHMLPKKAGGGHASGGDDLGILAGFQALGSGITRAAANKGWEEVLQGRNIGRPGGVLHAMQEEAMRLHAAGKLTSAEDFHDKLYAPGGNDIAKIRALARQLMGEPDPGFSAKSSGPGAFSTPLSTPRSTPFSTSTPVTAGWKRDGENLQGVLNLGFGTTDPRPLKRVPKTPPNTRSWASNRWQVEGPSLDQIDHGEAQSVTLPWRGPRGGRGFKPDFSGQLGGPGFASQQFPIQGPGFVMNAVTPPSVVPNPRYGPAGPGQFQRVGSPFTNAGPAAGPIPVNIANGQQLGQNIAQGFNNAPGTGQNQPGPGANAVVGPNAAPGAQGGAGPQYGTGTGTANAYQRQQARATAVSTVEGMRDRLDKVGADISEQLSLTPVRALSVSLGQLAQQLVGGRAGIQERARLASGERGRAIREVTEYERRVAEVERLKFVERDLAANVGNLSPQKLAKQQAKNAAELQAAEAAATAQKPFAEQATADAEAATKKISTPFQRVRTQALGVAGIVGGTLLFTAAMKAAQAAVSGLSVVVGDTVDSMTNFAGVMNKVTSGLSDSVQGKGKLSESTLAQQFATTGIQGSLLGPLRDYVQRQAGAQNYIAQSDLLRAQGNITGRDTSLNGTFSGFGNGPLAGIPGLGWIGQTPGVVERFAGDLKKVTTSETASNLVNNGIFGPVGEATGDMVGDWIRSAKLGGNFLANWITGATDKAGIDANAVGGAAISSKFGMLTPEQLKDPRVMAQLVRQRALEDIRAANAPGIQNTNEQARKGGYKGSLQVLNDQELAQADAELKKIGPQAEELRISMKSLGMGLKNADGSMPTAGQIKAYWDAVDRGANLPSMEEVLGALQPQITAQARQINRNLGFAQQIAIPAAFASNYFANPATYAGRLGTAGIVSANASASERALGGKYGKQITAIRGQLQKQADAGEIQVRELMASTGMSQQDIDSQIQGVKDLGESIVRLQDLASSKSLALETVQYNRQLFLAKRNISDLIGLQGKSSQAVNGQVMAASAYGKLQRQQIEDERELSNIQLARSRREIQFQLAMSRLQTPGSTPEERAARRAEAEYQAREAMRMQNIQERQTRRGFQIQDIGITREANDAIAALAIMQKERALSIEIRGIENLVAAKQQMLAVKQQYLDTTIQAGKDLKQLALDTQGQIEQATGDFSDQFTGEIRKTLNTIVTEAKKAYSDFLTSTGIQPNPEGGKDTPQNHGNYASGFYGVASGATRFTAGEAGSEHVLILRNPRQGMMDLGGGRGGGGVASFSNTFNINATGATPGDINEIARAVKRALHEEAALIGFMPRG